MTSAPEPDLGREQRTTVGDLVSGLLCMTFGLAVVLYVQTFPQLPGGAPGPGLFPGIIGALLALFGLVLAVRWFRDHRSGSGRAQTAQEDAVRKDDDEYESLLDEPVSAGTAWTNAASVVGSVVFYLVFADVLGFNLAMGVLLLGLMLRLGARWRVAVPSAVAATAFLYLVFERILLVPLPSGILG